MLLIEHGVGHKRDFSITLSLSFWGFLHIDDRTCAASAWPAQVSLIAVGAVYDPAGRPSVSVTLVLGSQLQ